LESGKFWGQFVLKPEKYIRSRESLIAGGPEVSNSMSQAKMVVKSGTYKPRCGGIESIATTTL